MCSASPSIFRNLDHQELPAQQRADAVSSLVYEANARMRDPVYGCVGAISYLQQQVSQLQVQLALAKAEILCVHATASSSPQSPSQQRQQQIMESEAYVSSLLMQNTLMNSSSAAHHQQQMLGSSLGSSGSTATAAMMLQEACLKKESLWA